MFSADKLKSILPLDTLSHYIIAYSGGLDSHVLLQSMHELQQQYPHISLSAVHVNHQLNARAQEWVAHCKMICAEFNITFNSDTIVVNIKPGDSLEEKARNARYDILKKYVDKNSILLTAHHLNDQAETFLLQALRGAGSRGMSAMPLTKKCGRGLLYRPLLSFSREQLEKYARDKKLKWIEDDSNQDSRFRRNFLRHEIFPLLKKHYPAALENFSRSARLIAEQEKIISQLISYDFKSIQTDDIKKIYLKSLREFSIEKQKLLLRHWCALNQLRMPNEKHIHQIIQTVVNAHSDAKPLFSFQGIKIRRDRQYLYLMDSVSDQCERELATTMPQ